MAWPVVMRIVAQVARALDHAHRNGVVHRDIKPANVIVLPSGEAKVTDFGIARLESARQRLTSTGEFIGTPLYTAPEQARVEDVDGRADIFSLASVAYTLLTGRPPFLAPTIPGIVHRVVYEEPGAPLAPRPRPAPRRRARARARAGQGPGRPLSHGRGARRGRGGPARGTAPAPRRWRRPGGGGRRCTRGAEPGGLERASRSPRGPPPSCPRRASRPDFPLGRVLVVVLGIGLLASFLVVVAARARPAAAPDPRRPRCRRPRRASPDPTAPTASQPEPAGRLRIDFDHPLERGTLRIFVDDELALEERLTGQRRNMALVFRMHGGTFREELDVKPGLHEVRVEVRWDDNLRRERIVGNFRPGLTRRLEASLGRIRRDLNLEWK